MCVQRLHYWSTFVGVYHVPSTIDGGVFALNGLIVVIQL